MEVANDKDVEGTEVGDPTKIELTEREILLAQGEDPDNRSVDAEIEGAPVTEDPPAEEETVEEQEVSWITDADRNRAKSYGLDPEDVDAYESREQFGKVLKALDKAASRKAPSKTDPTADDPADDDDEDAVDDSKPLTADGKINVAYYKANDYDEGTIAAMEVARKQQDVVEKQQQYLDSLQTQNEQAEYARHLNEFMDAADALRPDFYGVSTKGTLSREYAQRRSDLYDATLLVAQHIAAQQERAGKPVTVPPVAELVKRAELLAFGDSLPKSQQTAEKAKAQAAKIRPVGNVAGARRTATRKSTDDPVEIANDPDVVAAWDRAQLTSV